MARREQPWKIGDVFLLANADGQFSAGQIVGREADVLNSVTVGLFRTRFREPEEADPSMLVEADLVSVLYTTRDLLDSGAWRVIGLRPSLVHPGLLPHEDVRASGFVGAKIYGSGILVKFLDAFFGLAAWDEFHDPGYLDQLLLRPDLKPRNLVYKRA